MLQVLDIFQKKTQQIQSSRFQLMFMLRIKIERDDISDNDDYNDDDNDNDDEGVARTVSSPTE